MAPQPDLKSFGALDDFGSAPINEVVKLLPIRRLGRDGARA
jgi:hypothetical protein